MKWFTSLMTWIKSKPWLRNTVTVVGCVAAAAIFPVVAYAGIWALIGALTVWPSVWCLFTVAVLASLAIPALIFTFGAQLAETSAEDFLAHPVLHVAAGALLLGLIFTSWLYISLTISLVPILGLAALALGLGAWIAFAVICEVNKADAITLQGVAGLPKAAVKPMSARQAAAAAPVGSKLDTYLSTPAGAEFGAVSTAPQGGIPFNRRPMPSLVPVS